MVNMLATARPPPGHCSPTALNQRTNAANRVGAVWMIKRTLQDKWTTEKALVEAEAIGLRSEGLKTFAAEYIKAHQ